VGIDRLIYSDLRLGFSVTPDCLSWRAFVDTNLPNSLLQLKAVGLYVFEQDSIGLGSQMQFIECSVDASSAAQIAFALSAKTLSFVSCGEHVWTIGRCDFGASVLCIDCDFDPCVQDTSLTNMSSRALLWSPCDANRADSRPSGRLRALVVAEDELSLAPSIASVAVTAVRRDLASLSVTLSAAGTVACGVFPSTFAVGGITGAAIRLQNRVGVGSADNLAIPLNIPGLIASTDYDAYCVSYSTDGAALSDEAVRSTRTRVRTACCKSVRASVLSSSVREGSGAARAISLIIRAIAPGSDLRIALQYDFAPAVVQSSNSSDLAAPSVLHPNSISIGANFSGDFSIAVALRAAAPAGVYTVRVALSGASANDFDVSWDQSSTLTVLQANDPVPPPSLVSVSFSSSGLELLISLSAPSNRALLPAQFSCSHLFQFDGADNSACYWTSASSAVASIRPTSRLHIGDDFSLLGGTDLKATCKLSVDLCATWLSSSAQTVSVSAPALLTAPLVSIAGPSLLGSCDDLVLDLSASGGSYGRPWASVSISVESPGANMTGLAQSLAQVSSLDGPLVISRELLSPGNTYGFTARLCSFFDLCGRATLRVAVSRSSAVPVTTIPGLPLRSIPRSSSILLVASAFVAACDGSRSARSLRFSWAVLDADSRPVVGVASTSVDPKAFRLPPYSLPSQQLYTFVVTVTSADSGVSSSSSVKVYIPPGNVVAAIKGPSERSIRVGDGDGVILDGSLSRDEDAAAGDLSSLSFEWTCVQTSPAFSSVCPVVIRPDQSGAAALVSAPSESAGQSSAEITLTVSSGSRRARQSVIVSILSPEQPSISVSAAVATKFNPSDKLRISGVVDSKVAGIARWSSLDIDLDDAAVTPLRSDISPSQVSGPNAVFLVLSPFTLPSPGNAMFTLTFAPNTGQNVSTEITVSTNGPPVNGFLSCSPRSGTMMATPFALTASQWQDEDLPLSFEFSLSVDSLSSSSSVVVIRSRSESPFTRATLPSGLQSSNYSVTLIVQVFDSLGMSSIAADAVRVEPSALPFDQIQAALQQSLDAAEGDIDSTKQTIAVGAAVLNAANCSAVPIDCSLLNRLACSAVDNTCGECTDGYIGEEGSANSPCEMADVPLLAQRRLDEGGCSANSSCGFNPWLQCVDGACVPIPKMCPNRCSDRGQCLYRKIGILNHSITQPCAASDPLCVSECRCVTGFAGVSCSSTAEEYIRSQSLRESMALRVLGVTQGEDPSAQAVASWAASIAAVTSRPDELSAAAREHAGAVVQRVLSSAIDLNLPHETSLASVPRTLSSLVGAERLRDSRDLIYLYADAVGNSLTSGEADVRVATSQFSLVTSLSSASDEPISGPLTGLQSAAGVKAHSVLLHPSVRRGQATSIVTISADVYRNYSFTSDVVGIKAAAGASLCSESSGCAAVITIQNVVADYSLGRLEDGGDPNEGFEATCQLGQVASFNHSCSSGDALSVHCNGSWAGEVYSRCPQRRSVSVCRAISGSGMCSVLSYTAENTTCSCVLPGGSNRRLFYLNASSDDNAVQFAALLDTVTTEFVSTWQRAGHLSADDVKQNWAVLLTVALVGSLGLALSFVGHYADQRAAEVETESKRIDKASMVLASRGSRKSQVSKAPAAVVDECLPSILREMPLTTRISREMKVFHRWFGVVFFYSAHFKRVYRILSLFTSAIIMMAANAVTYVIAYPDDGSCAAHSSPEQCLAPQSTFSGGKKCAWKVDPDQPAGGTCEFREPADDIMQVVFVAVIAAMFSTPLALAADYLIMTYIAADTRSIDRRSAASVAAAAIAPAGPSGRLEKARSRRAMVVPDSSLATAMGGRGGNEVRPTSTATSSSLTPSTPLVSSTSAHPSVSLKSAVFAMKPLMRQSSRLSRSDRRRSSGGDPDEVLPTSLQEDMTMLLKDLRGFRDELDAADRKAFDGRADIRIIEIILSSIDSSYTCLQVCGVCSRTALSLVRTTAVRSLPGY
jgi:hypothetical protein